MASNIIMEQLMRSRYFLFALLLHLVVFLMIGSTVVYEAFNPPEDFDVGYVAGDGGEGGAPPPPPPPQAPQMDQELAVPTQQMNSAPMEVISSVGPPVAAAPNVPVPSIVAPSMNFASAPSITPAAINPASQGFEARASNVRDFVKGWGKGKPGTPGRRLKARFSVYMAKYQDGDWNTTLEMRGGKIFRSPITNLLLMSQVWTRDRIEANVEPKPLDLASEEIFNVKPPFIFFTGHKTFKLSPREVSNLRKYLLYGGAIWGDNGLAGRGSRFDVAFRREMKRVLPDANLQFEVLPNNHPIFTQATYFNMPSPGGPPAGMNYFRDPVEVIKLDGFIAVLYTLNNYTDMWRLGLDMDQLTKGNIVHQNERGSAIINETPWGMWDRRDFFYRNFEPEPAAVSYQFGLNIIIHLLIRFDNALDSP